MKPRDLVLQFLAEKKEATAAMITSELKLPSREVASILQQLQREGLVERKDRFTWVSLVDSFTADPRVPRNIIYHDWNRALSKLRHAYNLKLFALLVGPKGVGKTACILKLAELLGKPVYTVNFSLRTREHHFVGRLDVKPDGTITFKKGPLVEAMETGAILYLDEVNLASPACLIRLDEALDFRRQLNVEDLWIRAHPDFYCIASINPLDRYHAGTQELPGQLISRFPVRIAFDYPEPPVEYQIVKLHVPEISKMAQRFLQVLKVIKQLRNSDLPYVPSIRESITIAKLITSGTNLESALKMVLVDVYRQWDVETARAVEEILESRGLIKSER